MAIALAVVGTYIILKVVDFVLGVRVSAEQEEEGSISRNTAKEVITGKCLCLRRASS
ncbi:MAG: hypothetical protein WBM04_01515 [Candidatus Korobacteraceae bacterium]